MSGSSRLWRLPPPEQRRSPAPRSPPAPGGLVRDPRSFPAPSRRARLSRPRRRAPSCRPRAGEAGVGAPALASGSRPAPSRRARVGRPPAGGRAPVCPEPGGAVPRGRRAGAGRRAASGTSAPRVGPGRRRAGGPALGKRARRPAPRTPASERLADRRPRVAGGRALSDPLGRPRGFWHRWGRALQEASRAPEAFSLLLAAASFKLCQLRHRAAPSHPLWSPSASGLHLSSPFRLLLSFPSPPFRSEEVQPRRADVERAGGFVLKEKVPRRLKLPSPGEVHPPIPGGPCKRTPHQQSFLPGRGLCLHAPAATSFCLCKWVPAFRKKPGF